jgi:hypothetical protein
MNNKILLLFKLCVRDTNIAFNSIYVVTLCSYRNSASLSHILHRTNKCLDDLLCPHSSLQ